jgi:hypothetical protein
MPNPVSSVTFACCIVALYGATSFAQISPEKADCFDRAAIPDEVWNSSLVVLGEVHGTWESPRFVGKLVCSLAESGDEVVLALEIPEASAPNISQYMSTDSDESFTPAADDTLFWGRTTQDGRSSLAMAELISYAKELKRSGMRVDVFPFDRIMRSVPDRDGRMAATLRELRLAKPNARIVVLTGNVHARKTKGSQFNPAFAPMTNLLADLNPIALDVAHSGGTAWICRSRGCGEIAVRSQGAPPSAPSPFSLGEAGDAFDGVYFVGDVTASRPAVE